MTHLLREHLVEEGRLFRQLLAVVERLRLLVLAGRRVSRLVDGEGVQLVRFAVVEEDDACGGGEEGGRGRERGRVKRVQAREDNRGACSRKPLERANGQHRRVQHYHAAAWKSRRAQQRK
jgi:hypothetical protein